MVVWGVPAPCRSAGQDAFVQSRHLCIPHTCEVGVDPPWQNGSEVNLVRSPGHRHRKRLRELRDASPACSVGSASTQECAGQARADDLVPLARDGRPRLASIRRPLSSLGCSGSPAALGQWHEKGRSVSSALWPVAGRWARAALARVSDSWINLLAGCRGAGVVAEPVAAHAGPAAKGMGGLRPFRCRADPVPAPPIGVQTPSSCMPCRATSGSSSSSSGAGGVG